MVDVPTDEMAARLKLLARMRLPQILALGLRGVNTNPAVDFPEVVGGVGNFGGAVAAA
jgi:hypothetical protein